MFNMTQEEKQFLLADLCARLPYGVIIQEYNEEYGYADNALNTICIGYFSIHEACIEGTWINHIENVKPYLRSTDKISDEESNEMEYLLNRHNIEGFLDFVYSRHIDWKGLIEKNLAIEAPANMYNLKPI